MKQLHVDSLGGASGDMLLAALIDLGADADALRRALGTLPVEPFDLQAAPATGGHLRGTRVKVTVPDAAHPHRRLADVLAIIDNGDLPPGTRHLAAETFRALAGAEAAVHGSTPEHVHFHEVGAMDAIVDVVGACLALNLLEVDAVTCAPLPLGSGSVQTAHGLLPLPVPATLQLLKGHPVIPTEEPFELVTPTGAALLTTWQRVLPAPAGTAETVVRAVGIGYGHRALRTRPNLVRAVLREPVDGPAAAPGACLVLECNLDDTVPELLGSLCEALLRDGALDVFTTAVQMKKQRPGTLLTVLCRPADRPRLLDRVFRESTTFGVREHAVGRTVLARRHVEVATPYGKVRVKIGAWQGDDITRAPEHEDCVRLAQAAGVPVRAVYEAALQRTL